MFPLEDISTEQDAQYVAGALCTIADNPGIKYVKIDLIHRRRVSGTRPPIETRLNVWVQLDSEAPARVTPLANGGEIVHCRTEDGKRVDFLFAPPIYRQFSFATVVLELG